MKIPISKRLRLCAQLVPPGARVADIGTDHGYLGLYLLQNGLAAHVLAADLRPQPLQTAKLHAAKFGFAGQMEFRLSDGLAEIGPDEADTIVCAGMGGDLIVEILSACPWLRDRNYTLILQPQSAGQELRRWLGEHGFATALRRSVEGLMGAEHQRPERLAYYRSALEEVEEMRKNHENGTGNL